MRKFKRKKSLLSRKDRILYRIYTIGDVIGMFVGVVLCLYGNCLSEAPVNSAGEYVKSMSVIGNILVAVGFVILLFFGVLCYNLSVAKDEAEADLHDKKLAKDIICSINKELDDSEKTTYKEQLDKDKRKQQYRVYKAIKETK